MKTENLIFLGIVALVVLQANSEHITGIEIKYSEFIKNLPKTLTGEYLSYGKGYHTETYYLKWNKYSNSWAYMLNNRYGTKGYDLRRAFQLYKSGELK